ncbi:MAG TPA: aldolase/citrate lyase family protein [Pseudonocardiaceae bacterium]|jgi:2-keto-3-deoxy-L-rhamnonate aldolase RhmA|nr:aldolase/citrate lyase family protein [Pseudonocardiaceae bacterium]
MTTEVTATVRHNPFLDRLRAGELTLMLAIRSSRGQDILRIAKTTGHHAVMIDLEHSTMSLDTAAQLCAGAADLGLMPLARVPERSYGAIGRLLDGGAHGIVFPRIETVAQARLVSRACRFPPSGQRSALTMVPQQGMRPTPATSLNPTLDELTVVQVLLETPEGIDNADAIAELDGVDIVGIGANDLTAELGFPGDYRHPGFRAAVETAAKACRRHGKPLQVGGIGDLSIVESLLPLGISSLQLTGTDTDLLFSGAQTRVDRFVEWAGNQEKAGSPLTV